MQTTTKEKSPNRIDEQYNIKAAWSYLNIYKYQCLAYLQSIYLYKYIDIYYILI